MRYLTDVALTLSRAGDHVAIREIAQPGAPRPADCPLLCSDLHGPPAARLARVHDLLPGRTHLARARRIGGDLQIDAAHTELLPLTQDTPDHA